MSAHAAHPRCPECGKAMYKWMGKHADHANKPPKKVDPYAYCRNVKCEMAGKNQAEANEAAAGPKPKGKPKAESKGKTKRQEKASSEQPQKQLCETCGHLECVCPPVEPEAVIKARGRIKKALNGDNDYDHNVIGLALTILAQELGNKVIADQLIDEYKLTERFGIQKSS